MQRHKYTSWLWLLFAGIILIGIGVYAILQPVNMFLYFIKYTGYTLVVSSLFLLMHALTVKSVKGESKWLMAEGLTDLVFAAVLILNPFLATVAFPLLIGTWVLIRGMVKLFHFVYLSRRFQGRQYILMAGVLSLVAGFVIVLLPSTRIIEISYGMSVFAFISGALYIFDAIKFKNNEAMLAAMV